MQINSSNFRLSYQFNNIQNSFEFYFTLNPFKCWNGKIFISLFIEKWNEKLCECHIQCFRAFTGNLVIYNFSLTFQDRKYICEHVSPIANECLSSTYFLFFNTNPYCLGFLLLNDFVSCPTLNLQNWKFMAVLWCHFSHRLILYMHSRNAVACA